jgi:hypothetical protein
MMRVVSFSVLVTSGFLMTIVPAMAVPPPQPGGSLAAPPTASTPAPANGVLGRRIYPGIRTIPGVTGPTNTAGLPNSYPNGPTNVSRSYFGTNGTTTGEMATPGTAAGVTNTVAGGRTNITPEQLGNINRLSFALDGLGLPNRNQVDQNREIVEVLKAAPLGPIRPPEASILMLGSNLVEAVPMLSLTAAQRRQMSIDVNLALNSDKLTSTSAQRVIDDVRTILEQSPVQYPGRANELLGSLTTVVGELQAAAGQGMASVPAAASPNPNSSTRQVGQGAGAQYGQGTGNSPTR